MWYRSVHTKPNVLQSPRFHHAATCSPPCVRGTCSRPPGECDCDNTGGRWGGERCDECKCVCLNTLHVASNMIVQLNVSLNVRMEAVVLGKECVHVPVSGMAPHVTKVRLDSVLEAPLTIPRSSV